METSQPLSIDSFSYSWLVNIKPSLESSGNNSFRTSLDASDEAASSFIEMDPRMPPSKRFFRNSQDFKFDFPVSPPSLTFVHADQLISNGCLVPFFIDPVKVQKYEDEDFNPNLPKSSHIENDVHPANTSDCSSMRKCRKLSKKVLQKYLSFFKPLYQRIRGHRASSSKPENVGRRSKSMKNWEYSYEASPRISVAYSADDWRRSCDSESSIYEAVLHCKKSLCLFLLVFLPALLDFLLFHNRSTVMGGFYEPCPSIVSVSTFSVGTETSHMQPDKNVIQSNPSSLEVAPMGFCSEPWHQIQHTAS